MVKFSKQVKKNKERRRQKKVKRIQKISDDIILYSSLSHILDGILQLQNLSDEEKADSDAVRVLGKLLNKVTYLQQEGLSLLGEALPIQNNTEGRSDADDGRESVPEQSEDMADRDS